MASAAPPAQLGGVSWVLELHREPDHGPYTELHHAHVVGTLKGGYAAWLHQELVNTHQAHDVPTRQVNMWLPGTGWRGNREWQLYNGIGVLSGL